MRSRNVDTSDGKRHRFAHRKAAPDDLKQTVPVCSTSNGGLRFLGKTKGFGMRFDNRVIVDPYVKKAMLRIEGSIPEYLKGYTRSSGSFEGLVESISKFDRKYLPLPRDKWFHEAVRIAHAAFRLPKAVRPISIDAVKIQSPSASAGWTWLVPGQPHSKRDVREDALYEADKLKKLIRQKRLNKRFLPPCVTYKRTQLAEAWKPKIRNVWGYPFEITLLEGQYAQPLIEAYAQFDGPMYLGKTMLKELPAFIDFVCGTRNDGSRRWALGIDWSGFDSSVPPGLISIAFDVLRENLLLTESGLDELGIIEWYFTKTPLALPNGDLYVKFAGVPSGSFFTNIIDSIVNFVVIVYLQLRTFNGAWVRTKVYGDDSVMPIPDGLRVDLTMWTKIAQDEFGMVLNAKKSVFADNPSKLEFLGHKSKHGRVLREDAKLLRLALYPEYPVEDEGESVKRCLGYLVDSGYRSWPVIRLYNTMVSMYGAPRGEPKRFELYVLQQSLPTGKLPGDWKIASMV